LTVPVAAARSPRDFGVAKALVTAEAVRCDGDGANVGRPFRGADAESSPT